MPDKKQKQQRKVKQQQPQKRAVPRKRPVRQQRSSGLLSNIGAGLGGLAGSTFGPAGGLAGLLIGRGAGAFLSKITGVGDYHVNGNSLIHPDSMDQIPSFGNVQGGTRVRHREYIADILSSKAFLNRSFRINPANEGLFPWLSTMAQLFEQWKPMGIVFEYKSLYSDAVVASATTASLGAVVLATEYNALAARFVNKQQMENTQFVVSNKPSMCILHPVECERSQTPTDPLYVRLPTGLAIPGDSRLYDLGTFQLATQGMQTDGEVIGELWISYDIVFYKPVLEQTLHEAQYLRLNMQNVQAGFGSTLGLLGNTRTVVSNSLPLTISGSAINLDAGTQGYYMAVLRWNGAASSAPPDTSPCFSNFVNCSLINDIARLPFSTIAGNVLTNYVNASSSVPPSVLTDTNMQCTIMLRVIDNTLPASFLVTTINPFGYPNDASYGDFYFIYLGLEFPV